MKPAKLSRSFRIDKKMKNMRFEKSMFASQDLQKQKLRNRIFEIKKEEQNLKFNKLVKKYKQQAISFPVINHKENTFARRKKKSKK